MTLRRRTLVLAAAYALGGCRDSRDAPSASASAPSVALPPEPPAPADSVAYDDETSTRPIELLKARFTSEVKNREPADTMTVAHPGKRAYLHLVLRNRTGRERKVHLTFRVGGEVRTEIDLDVAESWSFRTWAYATLRDTDKKGEVRVTVEDDEGHPLGDYAVPIGS